MGKVHVLPDLLVNRIAAGEVIERPASVVKELLENAVDARATRIRVAIEDGGKVMICVTDDGEGMAADDLRLAVAPHATSKIDTEDDLFAVATMGFRGEALASIGAVSQMRIRSRPAEVDAAHEVLVVGERIELSRAAGGPPGTRVEVRDLFFNVPARRKFLRGKSTEAGHVNEQFARVALAHPEVDMEMTHNGRVTQHLPAHGSWVERVAKFFGRELADALMPVAWSERGLTIDGYVAPPARSRSSSNWQYVFVNGRFVRDRFVQHAVKEAYRGLMEPNRHPVVFLFLSIDPAAIDVNVHPTKIEVRWQDSNLVHSQVLAALREKFLRSDLTPSLDMPRRSELGGRFEGGQGPPPEGRSTAACRAARFEGDGASFDVSRGLGSPGAGIDVGPGSASAGAGPSWRSAAELWRTVEPVRGTPERLADDARIADQPAKAIQIHNAYIVAETGDGIVIVDQHALHERVLYEELRRRIAGDRLESQRLLLPETIPVTPGQIGLLETHADVLHRLGLEISPFGKDAVAVQALPTALRDIDAVGFVRDLLDRLSEQGDRPGTDALVDDLLSMMACKAAVKFGDVLSPEEIESLIAQRGTVEKSTNCPHGRPTALSFSLADLERQFKRR
jgi:DNA mismatch repair protein MutL